MKDWISKMFVWLNALSIIFYQRITFGALVAWLSAIVSCGVPMWTTIFVSVLAVATVAVGKGLHDGEVDWRGFGATICGGSIVWIALLIV